METVKDSVFRTRSEDMPCFAPDRISSASARLAAFREDLLTNRQEEPASLSFLGVMFVLPVFVLRSNVILLRAAAP